MKRYIWFFCIVMAVCVSAATAQQEYASESKSWRFVAPAQWNPIGFDIIKAGEAAERERFSDKNYTSIAGFTTGPMNTRTYPYIIVNKTEVDLSGVQFEDLDEALSMSFEDNERGLALLMLATNFTGEPGSLDRSRLRVTGWYDDKDDNGKDYHCTIYTYLGKAQSIQFECYDLKSAATQNAAQFREFVDSFAMRDDLKFVPATAPDRYDPAKFKESKQASSSGRSYRSFRYTGLGSGIIVAGVFLRIFLRSWARG